MKENEMQLIARIPLIPPWEHPYHEQSRHIYWLGKIKVQSSLFFMNRWSSLQNVVLHTLNSKFSRELPNASYTSITDFKTGYYYGVERVNNWSLCYLHPSQGWIQLLNYAPKWNGSIIKVLKRRFVSCLSPVISWLYQLL